MTIDAASTLARWLRRARRCCRSCRTRGASASPVFPGSPGFPVRAAWPARAIALSGRIPGARAGARRAVATAVGALLGGAVVFAQAAPPVMHVPAALQALMAPPAAPASDARAGSGAGVTDASEAARKGTGAGMDGTQASGDADSAPDVAADGAAQGAAGDAARANAARVAGRDAALAGSLDRVIATLESDRQRAALLAQLRQLRAATQAAHGAAATQAGVADTDAATGAGAPANDAADPSGGTGAAGAASAVAPAPGSGSAVETVRAVQAGLLGMLGSAVGALSRHAGEDAPVQYWSGRFNAAGNELNTIAAGRGSYSTGRALLDLLATLALWGGSAALLIYVQYRVHRRLGIVLGLEAEPTTRQLMVFLARRVGPWIIAFLISLVLARTLVPSFGRTVAMVLAYAVVVGAVFSALCLTMFSLFGAGHRRVAVHLLIAHSRRLLFLIGACGALGDATRSYDVSMMLGSNLAGLISTAANLCAAVLTGYFALAFRRPVAHLFINRSHDQRLRQKALTEVFEILGTLWHLPMLLLAVIAVTATLAGLDSSTDALRRAIVTALLLVLAFFITAVVRRITRPSGNVASLGDPPGGARHGRVRRQRRLSGYVGRFVHFFGTLLVFGVWCVFLELAARFWGHSLLTALSSSPAAQRISHALASTGVTLFSAWLLWLVIDTAIVETLHPSGHRGKSRAAPSTRARTILPLLRNVLLGALVVIVAISTLANMGLNVTPLLAGAGVIGLAIGFGAQSLVQDVITGLFILIEDTISIGDSVEVDGGHAGIVENLTVRTVRLRDGQGAIHSVPFSQIKTVKNLSRDFAYAVFEVRLAFATDIDDVTRMIRAVGDEMLEDVRYRANILGPVEIWGLDRFEANWMIVKGQIKTRPLQQSGVGRAFNLLLKMRMDEAGMVMPTPHMTVLAAAPAPLQAAAAPPIVTSVSGGDAPAGPASS
ncbi:mechanosensitive ion channel [Robbsia sp. Bb-Pol-6]|uniref:Mechanosensitive ion channel n=1 Tax=Robbsia betulipollinis TaxID=2981849 RepID=A0ABT3ZNJ5_9BURK|nr:mechanosensitive ion channel domain-containing protein [Robbsia betulipollinis]MCY0387825.1 mechanosensitive ion channel [Robbsia betulipollinis]